MRRKIKTIQDKVLALGLYIGANYHELAKYMGVSSKSVEAWATGKRGPKNMKKFNTLYKLCELWIKTGYRLSLGYRSTMIMLLFNNMLDEEEAQLIFKALEIVVILKQFEEERKSNFAFEDILNFAIDK